MKRRISKEEREFNALAKVPQKQTAKKESRKVWIRKCDDVFGLFIRTRDKVCRRCHNSSSTTQCSHVVPREYKALRWDQRNALGLCYYCHKIFWHGSPAESGAWYRKNFTDDWSYLEKKKMEKWSPSVDELKEIYNKYTATTDGGSVV